MDENDIESVETGGVGDVVFEKAEQEVMSFLPEMSVEELISLCAELGVTIPQEKRDSRKLLYRLVLGYLMQVEEDEMDGGKAKYIQIHAFLRQLADNRGPFKPPEAEVQANDVITGNVSLPEAITHHRALPGAPGAKLDEDMKTKFKIKTSTPLNLLPIRNLPPLMNKTSQKSGSLYQLKECKIRGSIGDPGEKDKLTYYGLLAQIVEKQNEGYDENRIVGAVINAITPGNVFKSRLEMRRNLEGFISLSILTNMLSRVPTFRNLAVMTFSWSYLKLFRAMMRVQQNTVTGL